MTTKNHEYQTVVLAALLHDIGKLLGRGSFKQLDKGQHPKFSADFISAFEDVFSEICDASLLHTLVKRHHESKQSFDPEFLVQEISDEHTRALATLVSKADNLSSSERGGPSEQWQDYKEVPLASVIERVNRVESEAPKLRYHPRSLHSKNSLDGIFPATFAGYERNELNKHIKEFGADFKKHFLNGQSIDSTDFNCLVSHILNMLFKYTWCIPSNTQEAYPDVSLYDHLKTTAAIASCLYLYHSNTGTLNEKSIRKDDVERFILVVGDLSGIQKYIFDIANIGAGGGVARRLRARSLYVQLCTEVVSHLILRKIGAPILINTLMNSGGRFYLLLPHLPEIERTLGDIQQTIDNWFINELSGELALNLAWVSVGDDGFKASLHGESGFGKILEEANIRLNSRKQSRFAVALCSSEKWAEDPFAINISYEGGSSCISCNKFPKVAGDFCSHCDLDREVGAILPSAKYIAYFDSESGEIPVLGHSLSLWKEMDSDSKHEKPYLLMKANDTDLADTAMYSSSAKFIAKFVALSDNCDICKEANSPVATFECIANRSNGDNLLGLLKADVDYLGESFIFGLQGDKSAFDTISRIATFSRMLDQFFSGWVERLTSEDGDFYTVYSGGDDLFILGPWDKILELADTIKTDFDRYTGNPSLTISAGIAITMHDLPISSAAEAADAALKRAKDEGRNRITVLGHSVTWDDWAKVKSEWNRLAPEVAATSSAFLYNLLEFAGMWEEYKKGNTLGLRYHPLLAYNVSRNLDQRKSPLLYDWAKKLLSIRPGDKEQEFALDNLGLVTSLLIYSKRGGGK